MAEERVQISAALRGAQEALARGMYQEVVRLCKLVLKQDKSNYDGFVLLGSALFRLKQVDQAEKALRLATNVNEKKMAAWQCLVELFETTANRLELVKACEKTREQAQRLGKTERYLEYSQKLAVAHQENGNFRIACDVWQELLDSDHFPETIRLEALCGLSVAKASLLEQTIQEEYKKRLSHLDGASQSSGRIEEENGCSSFAVDDEILCSVEEEFEANELTREVESLLRTTTSRTGLHVESHQEILLRLLVRRTRVARHIAGENWRMAKLQALRQCMIMLSSHLSMAAFEVAFKILEDDDSDDLLGELEPEIEMVKHRIGPPLVWLGKWFAHIYPWHGFALAALANSMHCDTSHMSSSLERKRWFCEKALRLEENCVTGWQVLADVHVDQGSYSSAGECIRRGLDALARSRLKYGLSLRISGAKLHLTMGQIHLSSQNFEEAECAFQHVAEEAKDMSFKGGPPLVAAANEGLAKVALARGEMELAFTRLNVVLSVNAFSHWAFAEQGWLAYQKGDWKAGSKYLEQAVALQPNVPSYHRRLGLLYWTAGGDMHDLKDKALSHFLETVKLDPTQSDVFRYLGHYYRIVAGDMQRAIRCYQKAVKLEPEDEEAGEALCDLLDSSQLEVLEVDICRESSQRSQRAFWAWRRLGLLQVSQKKWLEAVPNVQHALRGYVTDGDLWEALGLAYQHRGMLTAALKAYGRAISLGDTSPVFSLLQSGNILLLLASYGKATVMFREALEQVPQHVGALCGLAAAMLGRARECMAMGACSWSANVGKEAVDLLSQSVSSCSNVGAFWKLMGDLEVTYAQALPCEDLDSVSFSGYVLEAKSLDALHAAIDLWYQKRLSALKRAKCSYQRALHLSPSQGNLYSDLGLTLDLISSLQNDKSHSRSSWLPAVTAVFGGLRVEGDKPDLWVTLGMLTKHKGLRQHSFIQALRIDGNHARAWGGLGQLYLREGQEGLAREAFDRARSANPTLPIPWAGMAFFHSLNESKKDMQEAFASCLYAVQLSPTVEVQLGLGKIAAHTQQLHAPEVYTALKHAVHHAPDKAEAHNLWGLTCETRGDYEGAIKGFSLARYVAALPFRGNSGSSKENLAVSLNLARTLCKAGAFGDALLEYEQLAKLGELKDDSAALRGYAVALWRVGSKDKALAVAKKSIEVESNAASIVGGQTLLLKMTYSKLGRMLALAQIPEVPNDAFLDPKYCLSALAVAAACGDDHTITSLLGCCHSSFRHETMIQAHLLASDSKQISSKTQDQESAIQHLKKGLHLFPHSIALRTRLGQLLIESRSDNKANLVSRCCHISSSYVQQNVHYGPLCSTLTAATCACALCGNFESFKFPRQPQPTHGSSLLPLLQRWVHREPWNMKAHCHLVLALLQQARAQNYPINLCQAIRRLAATTLSMLPKSCHQELNSEDNLRILILVVISECAMCINDQASAIQLAETVSELERFSDASDTAVLQLARIYAAKKDFQSLQVELSKARQSLDANNILGWLTVIELEQQCSSKETKSTLVACKEAILKMGPDEQSVWMGLLHLTRAKGFIEGGDLLSAQKAAAEASALLPKNAVLRLLHGAICVQLASTGSNAELLSSVRSLSRAMGCSEPGSVPYACVLLSPVQNTKGISRGSEILKLERKLWTEWVAWPAEIRPAELYFQMGSLARKTQGTLVGTPGSTETSWTFRAWVQRAIHLKPDSVSYWSALEQQ